MIPNASEPLGERLQPTFCELSLPVVWRARRIVIGGDLHRDRKVNNESCVWLTVWPELSDIPGHDSRFASSSNRWFSRLNRLVFGAASHYQETLLFQLLNIAFDCCGAGSYTISLECA